LQETFTPFAKNLAENAEDIISELNDAQGAAIDMGGYYYPNAQKTETAMRPSQTLNNLLASF
jgi:isocitrate dehydrogenase